jgi:hypothetical protein
MKINFQIEKILNGEVILKDETGRTASWPASLLPENAKEGDKIPFCIGEENNLAKNILNEVLSDV